MVADAAGDLVEDRLSVGVRGLVGLDGKVDAALVDEAVAVGARDLAIDLRDHQARRAEGLQGDVDGGAQRAEAVLVGR